MSTIYEGYLQYFLTEQNRYSQMIDLAKKYDDGSQSLIKLKSVLSAIKRNLTDSSPYYLTFYKEIEPEIKGKTIYELPEVFKRAKDYMANNYGITDYSRQFGIKGFTICSNTAQEAITLNNVCVTVLKSTILKGLQLSNALVNLLNDLKSCNDSSALKYHLYGSACEMLVTYYEITNEKAKTFLSQQKSLIKKSSVCSEVLSDLNENYLKTLELIINNFVDYSQNSNINLMLVIAQKIVETKLLPNDLSNKDACYKISSYFDNRRVENEKEAINLYFQEKQKEDAKKVTDEQMASIMNEINKVVGLIQENISSRNQSTASIMFKINEINNKRIEEYEKLSSTYDQLSKEASKIEKELKDLKESN